MPMPRFLLAVAVVNDMLYALGGNSIANIQGRCSVGQRSSIGASNLKKEGFAEDYNVLGGVTAWTNLGYPTVK